MHSESANTTARHDAQLRIEQTVLEIARELVTELGSAGAGAGQPSVGIADTLDRDLGLDSLARVELLLRVQSALDVDLPQHTLETAETLRDLALAVARARAQPRAARGQGSAMEGAQQPATRIAPDQAMDLPPGPTPGAPPGAPPDPAAAPEHPGLASTLIDVLQWHCERRPRHTQITVLDDEGVHTITNESLLRLARRVAASLQQRGLVAGQTVALMLPTSCEYFYAYFGILLAGGVPVPIYPPARLAQLEEHVRRHEGILANAGAVFMITVPQARSVARALQARVASLREVLDPVHLLEERHELVAIVRSAQDVALIQYTSGSTGDPKGVVLTHANLLANIRAMGEVLGLRNDDVFVSWLPLYHDMGLIGAWLATLYYGLPLVVMSPLAFLTRPSRWLRTIDQYRGTLSAAPNFAYELCTAKIDDVELDGLDLSRWRIAFNGAEAVLPETLARFNARFARYGLKPQTLLPVYGLAECCVGLAFPPVGSGARIDTVQRDALADTGQALPAGAQPSSASEPVLPPLDFVSCGRPIPGHEIRIVDDAGRTLEERLEGTVRFRGPSATAGYRNNPGADAKLFRDGWLDTGDRGYVAEGDLFLTGRVKDIVIRGGRNIYPHEVEEAVGEVDGVRKGCVAVFGSTDPGSGTERLLVLAETRVAPGPGRERLQAAVGERVRSTLGEPPDLILLAPPHTVLKTSSGKIRRAACRTLYESGRLGAQRAGGRGQVLRVQWRALLQRGRSAFAGAIGALWAGWAWLVFSVLAVGVFARSLLAATPERAWAISRAATRWLVRLTRVPLTVTGLEHLPASGACVLVANHASYADGVVVAASLPRPCSFVTKRELGAHPLAGRYLRSIGAQFVERFATRQSVEDAARTRTVVEQGRVPFFFAEGTFTRVAGLRRFYLGAFATAVEAGVPVIPVAIRGTRELLPDGTWWPRRAALQVTVGAPITPPADARDGFAAAIALRDAARAHILAHCGEPDLAPPRAQPIVAANLG